LDDRVTPLERSCVITFNYDLAADFALRRDLHIDDALPRTPGSGYPLLKLHGSLNWFYCSTCGQIIPWDLQQFVSEVIKSRSSATAPIKLSPEFTRWHHLVQLGHQVSSAPVLAPPTWNKGEYHRMLSSVWSRAARELKDAENIFVIGYSLPPTDEFFRHLYSLGTAGKAILQRFWVFNPDRTGTVEERFRRLLGPGAEQRFEYFAETFGAAISRISKTFAQN
jgi:hypothetical protein